MTKIGGKKKKREIIYPRRNLVDKITCFTISALHTAKSDAIYNLSSLYMHAITSNGKEGSKGYTHGYADLGIAKKLCR
jgi:hypothetical protein